MGAQTRLGARSEMINPSETGAILHSARFARPVRVIYRSLIADQLRPKREFRVKQKGSAEVRSVGINPSDDAGHWEIPRKTLYISPRRYECQVS